MENCRNDFTNLAFKNICTMCLFTFIHLLIQQKFQAKICDVRHHPYSTPPATESGVRNRCTSVLITLASYKAALDLLLSAARYNTNLLCDDRSTNRALYFDYSIKSKKQPHHGNYLEQLDEWRVKSDRRRATTTRTRRALYIESVTTGTVRDRYEKKG